MTLEEIIQWAMAHADWVPTWLGIGAGVIVFMVAASLMIRAINARARRLLAAGEETAKRRGRRFNWKLELGFTAAQAGLSIVTVWGVYEFFHILLKVPMWESRLFAVFIESAIWTTVGFIIEHGRSYIEKIGKDGQREEVPATGWGMAGPFFWIFSASAGLLAVLAAPNTAWGVGRAVVVVVGTSLWVLRLMRATNRPIRRSRFRYTPYRIAQRRGWVEQDVEDTAGQDIEWRIQRLARAIRIKNDEGRYLVGALNRWRGERAVTRLAEETTPDVLRSAQERYAAVQVLREHTAVDSPVLKAIIDAHAATSVRLAQLGEQQVVDDAERRSLKSGDGGGGKKNPVIDDVEFEVTTEDGDGQGDVQSIAGQRAKDAAAAAMIVAIVSELENGATFTSWDQLRTVVRDRELLNKIEKRSQTTPVPMSRPRAKRILFEKAHTLFDAPPPPAELEAAKSA